MAEVDSATGAPIEDGEQTLADVSTADVSKGGRVTDLLTDALGLSLGLYLELIFAGWNVEGSGFFGTREAFENMRYRRFYEADQLAGRLRSLGAQVTVSDDDGFEVIDSSDASDLCKRLVERHDQLVKALKEAYEGAEGSSDVATSTVLEGIIVAVERDAWQLRAASAGSK